MLKKFIFISLIFQTFLFFKVSNADNEDLWKQCKGKNDGILERNMEEGGKKIFYCRNGEISWIETYKKNGKLDVKYFADTKTIEAYYENGKIENKITISSDLSNFVHNNNVGNAQFEEYYENGEIKTRGSYRNNLREGVWEHFYENGNLESIMNFVNDKFEGVYEQYKIDGSMKRQVSFKDGVAISGKKYDNYGIPRDMTRAELYNEYNKK